MGRLKSVAVFQEAENCLGKGFTDPMPCCQDVSEELKVEELTKASFEFKSTPDLYELASISWILLEEQKVQVQRDKPHFLNYLPPPPDRDIPVLVQSFLI